MPQGGNQGGGNTGNGGKANRGPARVTAAVAVPASRSPGGATQMQPPGGHLPISAPVEHTARPSRRA